MLIKKCIKNTIFYFFFLFFFTNQTFAEVVTNISNEYYKCPEKINTVISGESQKIKIGSIIGVNYVKLHGISSPFTRITIKFKETGSQNNAKKIIHNKRVSYNSLGYEIFNKFDDNGASVENTYNFIKVKETYAFIRKEFYWSSNNQNQLKKNYEYESSGRCLKIEKEEFEKESVIKTAIRNNNEDEETKKTSLKSEKITKKSQNIIRGERSVAISWEGYDDLILGNVKFSERDLMGVMVFTLPNDGDCIGTYALSTKKGTWSIYCENRDVNASGILKWDNNTGEVSGNGKDSDGNKIKFKVAKQN